MKLAFRALAVILSVSSVGCSKSAPEAHPEPAKQEAPVVPRQWPPLEFKGIKVGVDDIAKVQDMHGKNPCKAPGRTAIPGRLICSAYMDFAGRSMYTSFYTIDRTVHHVAGMIDSDNFGLVKQAFSEKYGPPTEQHSEDLQNSFGAEFKNEILTWSIPEGGILVVNKYGSTGRSSIVMMMSGQWLQQEQAQRDAQPALKDRI